MPAQNIASLATAIGAGINNFATHSAQAAAKANGVSSSAQLAQGQFNAGQAQIANNIGSDRIAQQYGYNAAQAAMANQFSADMMSQAMAFNAEEAQKNRDWQEKMMSTAYQRAVKDMEKAGLNPVLAVTGGGISTGSGSGSAASISAPSGAMASGGLINGITASEGNYTGQMEYMGGMLGLLSAALGGLATAAKSIGGLGDFGTNFAKGIGDILDLTKESNSDGKLFGVDVSKEARQQYKNEKKSGTKYIYTNNGFYGRSPNQPQ